MRKISTKIDRVTRQEVPSPEEEGFPYRAALCEYSAQLSRDCPWHWHPDVELFCMREGSLTYRLPGRSCVFRKGDIGFVNANVLHMAELAGDPFCLQQEHIFRPELVGGDPDGRIWLGYVLPLIRNRSADLIRIPAEDPAAERLRRSLDRAYHLYEGEDTGREIRIRALLSEVWLELLARMPGDIPVDAVRDTERVETMIKYIGAHYAEPVTLSEIASEAHISVREACRCFKRQIGTTVFSYLLDLRIRRACELLSRTDLPVTGIALRCGFSAPSYFGKQFRLRTGMTPVQYRREGREGPGEGKQREE